MRPPHAFSKLSAHYRHFIEVARALTDRRAGDARAAADVRRGRSQRRSGHASICSSCRVSARSRRGRRRRPTSRTTAASTPSCASSAASLCHRDGRGSRAGADDRAALLPLIHDRMTETVVADPREAARLFAHFPPRPLTTIPLREQGQHALEAANARARARAVARRDRLSRRGIHAARARPDRCRAHDVRAGELRALPAQDLQCVVAHRRQSRSGRASSR